MWQIPMTKTNFLNENVHIQHKTQVNRLSLVASSHTYTFSLYPAITQLALVLG